MLRPESFATSDETLGGLCTVLANLRSDHVEPFNRRPFHTLISRLNEKSVPQVKLINAVHHTYDGTIGFTEAQDVEAYWRTKLHPAFLKAFRLAADYDAYGGVSRLFAWQDTVIPFPGGHTENVKSLSLRNVGVAAAAASDGRIGDGEISLMEVKASEGVTLYNHDAYQLNTGTLEPVAGIGDIVLVQNFGEPRATNLTVAAYGDTLLARRLNESSEHPEILILTGQATDPYSLPEPVLALKDKIVLKKIVGTIFTPKGTPLPKDDGHELIALSDFSVVEGRLKDVKLFKVKGRSMEPVALEGQYVMTQAEAHDAVTLKRLSGELVIAVDLNGGIYFKRLRLHGQLVVLESANSNSTTSSEVLCLEPDGAYPQLTSLLSVVGVLFELPKK